MIHHAGGSSRQDWERAQTQYFDSVFLYFTKHSPGQVRALRLLLPPALWFRAFVLFWAGRFRHSKFYLLQGSRILRKTG